MRRKFYVALLFKISFFEVSKYQNDCRRDDGLTKVIMNEHHSSLLLYSFFPLFRFVERPSLPPPGPPPFFSIIHSSIVPSFLTHFLKVCWSVCTNFHFCISQYFSLDKVTYASFNVDLFCSNRSKSFSSCPLNQLNFSFSTFKELTLLIILDGFIQCL